MEYVDADLIGLTATPNKQTFSFFNQNLVMEYSHEQAVVDGVKINDDVYRIRTAITAVDSKVDAGFYVEKRDRETCATRWEQLSDDFAYDPDQLDRNVVAPDQIRTIVKAFKDKRFTDIFPGRTERLSSSRRTMPTRRTSSESSERNSARVTNSPRRSPIAPPG